MVLHTLFATSPRRRGYASVIRAFLCAALMHATASHAQTLTWGPATLVNQACVKCNTQKGDLKVSLSGNAVAVWVQNDGVPDIAAARYDAVAGVWRGFKTLYQGVHEGEFVGVQNPRLVMDSDGNVMAFWTEVASSTVFYARYRASDATWTLPATLHVGTGFRDPELAVGNDALGNVFVHWNEDESRRLMVKRYDTASRTWSASIPVTQNVSLQRATMAVDLLGNAMVIWQRESDNCIIYSRYTKRTGQWSAPRFAARASTPSGVQIVLDNAGNGTVFFKTGTPTETDPYALLSAARYDAASDRWSGPRVLQSPSKIVFNYDYVVDAKNNVMLITGELDNFSSQTILLARRFNARTGQWSMPIKLTGTPSRIGVVDMTLDQRGNIVAILHQSRLVPESPINAVFIRKGTVRFDNASQQWGAVKMLASETYEAYFFAAGVDVTGKVIALYQQDSGYRWHDTLIYEMRAHQITTNR